MNNEEEINGMNEEKNIGEQNAEEINNEEMIHSDNAEENTDMKDDIKDDSEEKNGDTDNDEEDHGDDEEEYEEDDDEEEYEDDEEEYDEDEEMGRSKGKNGCAVGCSIIMLAIIGLFIASVVIAMGFMKDYRSGIVNHNKENGSERQYITFTVEEGATLREISEQLESEGLVDHAFVFESMARDNGLDTSLQPGDYILDNYMQFDEISTALQNAKDDTEYNTFTIIEGQTQREIAQAMEEAGIMSAEEFNNACNTGVYDYDFLKGLPEREYRLEGYLFPDTYYFAVDASVDEIMDKILSRFDEVFTQEMREQAQKKGLTIDEAVTMASVIEGEVRYPEERARVAAVIYNRLEIGMPLQMDATVLYAKGEHSDTVWEEDTKIESEYNTYYVTGLPKGPIGNPGAECLKAALYPEDNDYIYYVVENQETGQHYFTNDYNDFLAAKERYMNMIGG
ncbi:MAG: endolytic transglycosylase MltG [Firmicutes bacterium]|nr:endolytic transglycosylase MltG [Bacillota bacterium]